MEFEHSKCIKVTFKIGKLTESNSMISNNDTMIEDLNQEQTFDYLWINEGVGIEHASFKEKILKEYIRRVRPILKTELIDNNRITIINTLAVRVVSHSLRILSWKLREITKSNNKTIKLSANDKMLLQSKCWLFVSD